MLLLILTISTLYQHVPHVGQVGFILNPDVTLSYNQYFWVLCEHLIMVTFALIILDEATDHRMPLKVFVALQILDVAGFVLSYNDPLKDYLITFNILKVIIFGCALSIEIWNQQRQG